MEKKHYYNVPINSDKNFNNLSEPDIINDRILSEKRVHIKCQERNLQQNSKLKLYWSYSKKKNRLAK